MAVGTDRPSRAASCPRSLGRERIVRCARGTRAGSRGCSVSAGPGRCMPRPCRPKRACALLRDFGPEGPAHRQSRRERRSRPPAGSVRSPPASLRAGSNPGGAGPYLGLVPRRYRSGGTDHVGSITRIGGAPREPPSRHRSAVRTGSTALPSLARKAGIILDRMWAGESMCRWEAAVTGQFPRPVGLAGRHRPAGVRAASCGGAAPPHTRSRAGPATGGPSRR